MTECLLNQVLGQLWRMSLPNAEKKTRRQEQADTRREQLLAAALERFAEQGFRGTTTRDIAQAAGVTEGLIYHYFPGKAALLKAVIERYSPAREMNDFKKTLHHLPVREAFLRLGLRLLDLLTENRTVLTMVHAEALRDPEVAQVLGEFFLDRINTARPMLEARVAAGELRPHDTMITVRMFQAAMLWFVLMHHRLSPPLPEMEPERYVRGVIDIMMNGLAVGREGEAQ